MAKDRHTSKKVLASSENFITSTPTAQSSSNHKEKLTKAPTRTPGNKASTVNGDSSSKKASHVKPKRSSNVAPDIAGSNGDDSINQVKTTFNINPI